MFSLPHYYYIDIFCHFVILMSSKFFFMFFSVSSVHFTFPDKKKPLTSHHKPEAYTHPKTNSGQINCFINRPQLQLTQTVFSNRPQHQLPRPVFANRRQYPSNLSKSTVNVSNNVVNIFQTAAKANHTAVNSSSNKLFVCKLTVSSRSRM